MNVIYTTIQKLADSRHGLLLVLSFSVILKGLLFILKLDTVINTDGVHYISAAKQFAAWHVSEGLAIYPMPLYPFLIALVHFFIPDWVVAARLISYVCLVFMLIPLYMLARDLFDRRAAFWASLVLALLPESMRFTLMVIRDPSFFLLFVWAVFLLRRCYGRSEYLISWQRLRVAYFRRSLESKELSFFPSISRFSSSWELSDPRRGRLFFASLPYGSPFSWVSSSLLRLSSGLKAWFSIATANL